MTPVEVLARIAAARRALVRSMALADSRVRYQQIESLLGEICVLRRNMLVADFEHHVEVVLRSKPVFDWLIWKLELTKALSSCEKPAPGVVESYEGIIAEIGLRVQMSNATVDIDDLIQNPQSIGTEPRE